MPNTFFGLTIGSSGLNAANIALNTTSHNIANIETDGYSRQKIDATAADALRMYSHYGMQGSGVAVHSVKQIRDSYYDHKYWNNNRHTGEHNIKHHYTKQIEELYYNEMTDSGFTKYYGNFCNSLDSLSATPSQIELRNQTIEGGQTLADYFNNIAENLMSYQDETNSQIKMVLDRINTIAENIASLNGQISTLEMNGGFANDLRDKRNTLVDELSGLAGISIKEVESPTGSTYYDIKIANQTLVYGTKYHTLHVEAKPSSEKRHDTDMAGLYEIKWSHGQVFDTYNETLSGELMGYIQIRDGDNLVAPIWPTTGTGQAVNYKGVPYYMEQTNQFVAEYARQFNTIHMSGEDLDGNSTAEVPFFTIKNMTVDQMKDEILNAKEASITYTGSDKQWEQLITNYKENNPNTALTDTEIKTQILNGYIADYKATNKVPAGATDAEVEKLMKEDGFVVTMPITKKEQITTEHIVNYISDNITAENVCVNPDLIQDNRKMGTAGTVKDGVETPDVATQLANLRKQKTFRGGMPEEWVQSLLSVASIDAESARDMYTNHGNIGEAIINQRLSVMGVDKEEEAVALVKYQHMYELSSKVISVMNEIYDRLINQTGV